MRYNRNIHKLYKKYGFNNNDISLLMQIDKPLYKKVKID